MKQKQTNKQICSGIIKKTDSKLRAPLLIKKMVWIDSLIWLISISFFIAFICWLFSKNSSSKLRPPGPSGWPVIGNVFDLGTIPHQNLQKLQSKYGPVLWLKLGSMNTMVIQSAAAATELFKKHDLPFSDRRVPDSLTACDYQKGSMVFARYSKYPRYRRFLATELLVQKRMISVSAPARQKCIDNMIQWIKVDSDGGSREIILDRYLVILTFNMIANFVVSRDIMDSNSEEGNQFFEAVHNFVDWAGKPNIVDSFPFLKWLDPQRIMSNTEKYTKQLLKIIEGFVKERMEEKLSGLERTTKDFLDACLEYEGDDENGLATDMISEKNMTILILEMFLAGTETTSGSIHWAMSELLRNPDSMKKLKAEIDKVIGHSGEVEESDLTQLPYLQAVVKETMRLHPPLPFLIPRNSVQDTEFMGYNIPKNTLILVNAWAIHRDPESWDDPLSFNPDRFLDSNIDHKGQHFELLPFGSGRRSCIGMFLGDKMVSLTLARLIQSFDWVLPAGVSPDAIDMREAIGIVIRKVVPLKVISIERHHF